MATVKKLIMNTSHEFLIKNFSRNTYNQDGRLVSSVYVILESPTSQALEELRSLAMYTIENLSIKVDDETVYQLADIEGRINSIEETLGDDGVMRTSFSMTV